MRPSVNSRKKKKNQHVLGVLPSFSVVYGGYAPPLDAKQKFELAFRGSFNTYQFVAVGLVAAIGQAQDNFPEYGQGWEGYGKRYGAGYLDSFRRKYHRKCDSACSMASGIHGTSGWAPAVKRKIPLTSVISAVRCKGETTESGSRVTPISSGTWPPECISNLYYPGENRIEASASPWKEAWS